MTNYLKDIKKLKLVLLATCIGCTLLSVMVIKQGIDSAEDSRRQVFVSDTENTLLVLLSNEMEVNRPKEARSFVKRFHTYMFQFSPAANMISGNLEKAQRISDNSLAQYIEKEKERGYYNALVAGSVSTEYRCDSIRITESDLAGYRYHYVMYGKTSTISTEKIEYRVLVTSGYLRDCDRTISEPIGYNLCLFKVEQNAVFRTLDRTPARVEPIRDTVNRQPKQENN